MTFGENPKKVRNIVDGNFQAFREIYRRKIEVIRVSIDVPCSLLTALLSCKSSACMQSSPFLLRSARDSEMLVSSNQEEHARSVIVNSLPSNVLGRLESKYPEGSPSHGAAVTKKQVQRVVASIVNRYSRSQSIKGIATAGGVKTITYVAQKLQRTYLKRKK